MAIACPSCGQENPDGFRLCGMCGAALAPARPAVREERKVVTALFCDLVGSTARAEGLDPEDVRALLSRYHAHVRAELERHGGTVEKFIGDAVMALFGAPVSHEDDPERAVRAALAIREYAAAQDTELRIGITTGEALIALGARPAEGEGMASGDVVNTAARLQSAAPVNGILVDAATHRATGSAITYREAPPVEAKGKARPIEVWEAVEARSRFGIDVTHHARVNLVGRERELEALRAALERARDERLPQLVTLVAVPGMGKSRLIYELSRIADAEADLITWRQGRCLAYGEGVAFWALGEVVKAQAGIAEQDSADETASKLTAAVAEVIEEPGERAWVERHLRPLVGIEAAAGLATDRRGEAFAAWRRYLEALAEWRPLVLVLEDLHWADDGLLDFVDQLVDWLTDVPLLVVCSARPELLERRPAWGGGKLNASTLALSPLSSEQTATLLTEVLGSPRLAPDVARTLLARVEGNPLYAEQFAELVLERGVADDLAMPETLQGIVAARLDGLASGEKAVLQEAAVMGKVFWAGSLAAVGAASTATERGGATGSGAPGGGPAGSRPTGSGPSGSGPSGSTDALLQGLARKGFLTRQRRSSVEQETEWAFAHMLLRDVAYAQIPRAERSAKHRRAAEWIGSLGRPDHHAELLAHHWRTAIQLAEAAGLDTTDLVDPARRALRAAGERSYAVNAFAASAGYFDAALARWPAEDDERPALLYQRADALYMANDARAEDALVEARNVLFAAGDRDRAALAQLDLSRIAWFAGRGEDARALGERAMELARDAAPDVRARVQATIARTTAIGGDPPEGFRLAQATLDLLGPDGPLELRAHLLATVGLAKTYSGVAGGREDQERALSLAIEAHSPIAGSIANNVAVLAWFDVDPAEAHRLFTEGLAIAERFGDVPGVDWHRGQLIGTAHAIGHWDEALRGAEAWIAARASEGTSYLDPTIFGARADIRLARGDLTGAAEDARTSVARARESGDPQQLLPHLSDALPLLEAIGRTDEARALAEELVDVAERYPQDAAWGLGVGFALSPLALGYADRLRDVFGASPHPRWLEIVGACLDRDYGRAADLFAVGGARRAEARARFRAAEVALEEGRRADAEEQMERALAFYREVGGAFWIERGEALLAGTG